ncbi:MAG TPA: homoserine dehydrogenase [Planctomycetaceae bacterium]|nr:homoserine dehydrogenase [Planctomycetaceae bacterium]
MPDAPLKIAIVGLGTVGTGVARVLLEHPDRIARRAGRPIRIGRVAVRDPRKARDVALPDGTISGDVRTVIDDPDIDVALELMGGLEPARRVVADLLRSGKDVVTANKALIYEHGDELFALARETGRTIAFEAAVAGGVPIIQAVGQALAANQITSIEGVLNGTSNFILTEMAGHGRPYAEALALAQEKGYAEADPSMDVDGTDAAHKLVILAQLAFGTKVRLEEFPRQGIDTLELADLNVAAELGYRVKLLAVARLEHGRLEMHVQPTLVRMGRPLAEVDGVYNRIGLRGDVVGKVWFTGMGAGQMATASAVVSDLIDVASGRAALTFPRLDLWHEQPPYPVLPADRIERRYYLRFNVEDRPHVFADIADILGRHGISLASIIQHEAPEPDDEDADPSEVPTVPVVVMTHRTAEGRIRTADRELDRLSAIHPPRVCMPVAD